MPAAAFLAAALLVLTGCQTPDPLAPAVSGRITTGQTQAEVRQALGSPTYFEQAPSGSTVETYEALQTIFGQYGVREREEALEIRQFSVRYDAGGRVEKSLFHRGVMEGFTRLYSRQLGPEFDPARLSQVRSGQTTRAEVEKLFGPPTLARLNLDAGLRLEWVYQYVEAAAVTAGSAFRSIEITLDDAGVVQSVKAIDRVFPTWRR